jgi:hypothetical protein
MEIATQLNRRSPIKAWQVVFGFLMASTSGAAILAHVYGPLPMGFTVPFIVMPSVFFLIAVVALKRNLHLRFEAAANALRVGAIGGFYGTIVYDLSRPLIRLILHFKFNPFGAMPIFGSLMTGRPETDHIAIVAGWLYHFWNGISFGMMFSIVRPSGSPWIGALWGFCLQCLMFASYPQLLHVRMNDPGFITMGLIGHTLWGGVLGWHVKKQSQI